MADNLMYIPNDDKQYCPFYRLQLVVETNQSLSLTLSQYMEPYYLCMKSGNFYFGKLLSTPLSFIFYD